MKFGLNLYSIRNLVGTPEGFRETAHKLKEMGYDTMQISGVPYDPALIASVSKETDMPIVLTHVALDRIINDTEALMDEHASFGCKNIGLGSFPFANMEDPAKMVEQVAQLNEAGERMSKRGFKFFYHNHHYEFYKNNGQTVYDYMIENAPAINFTLDTYWLQYAGVDVLSTIARLKGRIGCTHLKDYQISIVDKDGKPEFKPTFAPVGNGLMDFTAILAKMRESGARYFFVEQDNAAKLPDPLGEVEQSVRYVKNYL